MSEEVLVVRPPQILNIDANSVMLGKLHADERVVGYGGVGGVSRGLREGLRDLMA